MLHDSLVFYGPHRFDLRVVDSSPSNCSLAGNATLIIQVMAFDLSILSFFGRQRHKFIRIGDSSGRAISAVTTPSHGLQSLGYL
jgi:hypothetical protein